MFWQGNALERNLAGRQKRAYAEIIRLYGLWLCAERKLFLPFAHPKLVILYADHRLIIAHAEYRRSRL